jgi:NADPH:quinone reductase-like Zn-dependent oxidoreductase
LLQGNISLVKPFSFSHTPGYDVARIVVDIGSEVRRFQIDDKVFGSIGINGGTFVGYVCGEKSMFTLKPNNFSMLEAPAIADSCPISYQVLFQKPAPAMGSGSKVFVCWDSSAAGLFAIQMAKAVSAHVTTCSHRNFSLIEKFGSFFIFLLTKSNKSSLVY